MVNEKLNILRMLIENQEEFSIRQIAKKRGINYKSAYNAVLKLEKEKVIDVKRKGNISLCSFNRNYNDSVYLVESERRKQLFENKNFKIIYAHLSKISSQFVLILFGSYVYGKQTKHSDIDFLLIGDNIKEVREEFNLIPLDIHVTGITYKDFIKMLLSKEMTVVSEALKKNIILFGIEDYYRLVKNAK